MAQILDHWYVIVNMDTSDYIADADKNVEVRNFRYAKPFLSRENAVDYKAKLPGNKHYKILEICITLEKSYKENHDL